MSFTNTFDSKVVLYSAKLSQINIKAVSEGLWYLAITFAGAFFIIIQAFLIPVFQTVLKKSGLAEVFLFISTCTLGFLKGEQLWRLI